MSSNWVPIAAIAAWLTARLYELTIAARKARRAEETKRAREWRAAHPEETAR